MKKRKHHKNSAAEIVEFNREERHARDLVVEGEGSGRRYRKRYASVLEKYFRHGLLGSNSNENELAKLAGDKLADLFNRSEFKVRFGSPNEMLIANDRNYRGGYEDANIDRITASDEYLRALICLTPYLRPAVRQCVCEDRELCGKNKYDSYSLKRDLRLGLKELAVYFGIKKKSSLSRELPYFFN